MTTICERGRRILPWILERANVGDEFAAFDVTSRSLLHAELWNLVHDSAKLAEMLAARGRELGFVSDDTREFTSDEWRLGCKVWDLHDPYKRTVINIFVRHPSAHFPGPPDVFIDPPQARAILLQWLQLPDGAREQALQALRGAA